MRRASRPAVTVMLAAVILAGVAGCQRDKRDQSTAAPAGPASAQATPTESARQVLAAAYRQTIAAKSARFSLTQDGALDGRSLSMTGEGVVDFVTRNVDVQVTMPQLGTLRTLKLGNLVYEQLPERYAAQLGGRRWVKIDLTKLTDPRLAAVADQLRAGSNQDPASMLGYLSAVSSNVRMVDSEAIRGETTTHYTTDIDIDTIANRMSPAAAKSFREFVTSTGATTMKLDVWVDPQRRIRRVQNTLPDASPGPAAPTASWIVTQEFYDFGSPVPAEPPPASETTDLSALVNASVNRATR